MMKTKYLIAIVFAAFFLQMRISNSQDNQQNLAKYWHYRHRLKDDFMVVGDGPGMSLPATTRNYQNSNTLAWEETPRYLAWYIGVLATEYRLLKNNNQPLNETEKELYYALKAVIRLDNIAETGWVGYTAAINGFLVKDDVYDWFVNSHISELNRNSSSSLPPFTFNSGASGYINSVYSATQNNNNSVANPLSIDMTSELLLGMALVSKCVDRGGLTFQDNSGNNINVDLWQMAIDETNNIMMYLSFNHNKRWEIDDPTGTQVQYGGALDLSQGFAHAGGFITGNNYTDYDSETLYAWEWQGAANNTLLRCNSWNMHIILSLAAMSDYWIDAWSNNVTKQQIKYQSDYDYGVYPFVCAWWANHYGFDLFYGTVHRYLHGYDYTDAPSLDMCTMHSILNSAPSDGPFFHYPYVSDISPLGWRCGLRFSVGPPDQSNGAAGDEGNYNGLDYMLFHNMYYLMQTKGDRTIIGDFPYTTVGVPETEDDIYGRVGSPEVIANPYKRIKMDNVTVTTSPFVLSSCQCPQNFTGKLIVYGGSQGVKITNTTVDNGGRLFVGIHKSCSINPADYILDTNPWRVQNNTNENLPPYVMSDEFKQATTPPVLILPNPSPGIFTLQLKESGIGELSIYSSLGQIVFRSSIINNQSTIDLSSRPRGIYFLKVQTPDKLYTEKIILQ